MSKRKETVTQSQKVDVYLHFLEPERTKSRPVGALERVRLLAFVSVASVMTTIGVMRIIG